MKTRRQNYGLTISRRNSGSKTPENGGENAEPIPIDLIIEIFSRLPAKSIAKCRCVRKHWASILRRPDFTELFLTRSSARPMLLFACQNDGKLFFFSASQPQYPDENSPSSIDASYLMEVPFSIPYEKISHVNGLALVRDQRIIVGRKNAVTSICNPSTRQSLNLPKVKSRRKIDVKSFLGYDPIGKQYKVLSMTSMYHKSDKAVCEEHQVLTLGTEEWRMVECCVPHYPLEKGICINGVLYYTAAVDDRLPVVDSMIVSFDVRLEKFRVLKRVKARDGTLISYKGKLGLLAGRRSFLHLNAGSEYRSFKFWVLEDAEKEEWSEYSYELPSSLRDIVGTNFLRFIGVTRTNEIVLSPDHQAMPFYVIFYNIDRNTMVRVEIQGIDASKYHTIDTFVDHVEDVKLM